MAVDDIGKRLRQLRKQKKVTLKQLGEGVDLSVGYLSQVERGRSAISINQLAKVADYLDTNVEYFIAEAKQEESIVTRGYERSLLHLDGLSIEYKIVRNLKGKSMMSKLVEIQPGFQTEDHHAHEGEEFLYILEGVLELHVENEIYTLYPQDTAYYDASRVHCWANNTNMMTTVLYVSTPNPFDKMETNM